MVVLQSPAMRGMIQAEVTGYTKARFQTISSCFLDTALVVNN